MSSGKIEIFNDNWYNFQVEGTNFSKFSHFFIRKNISLQGTSGDISILSGRNRVASIFNPVYSPFNHIIKTLVLNLAVFSCISLVLAVSSCI